MSYEKGERTVNLVARFDEVNGDDGFVELKVRVTPRRKGLCLSRRSSLELAMVKIGLPIIGFQ